MFVSILFKQKTAYAMRISDWSSDVCSSDLSPPKVWTALTRFEDYERWNPFIRIAGRPEAGALVQYSFRMKSNKPRFFTIDACIITFEPQRRMTFRFGFGGLLRSVEHTSELQSLLRISYAVFCLQQKTKLKT